MGEVKIVKKTLKIIFVVLFTILGFLHTNVQSNAYAQSYTPVMGQSQAAKAQAFQLLRNNNSAKTDAYIRDFVDITWEEAAIEGVRADVAFSLMMLETGWLKFGGDVKEDQNNFGGIGATGGGNPGHEFPDIQTGIRAVVQHLKAYASSDPLRSECVDPRFKYVTRASAVNIEWLGIRENPEGFGWAAGYGYGYKIITIMNQMSGKATVLPYVSNLNVERNNDQYTITATASKTAAFKFVIEDLENGTQTIIQNYSNNGTITWDRSSYNGKKIRLATYVKDAQGNIGHAYYHFPTTTIESFDIGETEFYAGKSYTATATASSVNKPMYRFWLGYYSNGKWSWNMLQDYSINNKITWTPTKPGLYEVNVHVRDSNSSKAYEVVKFYDITVKAPSTKIQTFDIGGTEFYAGKSYTAIATATSVNKPMYKFWLGYYSNGKWSWNMLQDYSTNNKITWTPTKPGLYEVNVHVRDSNSSKAYEVVKFYDITVKAPSTAIQSFDIGGTTFYAGKNYTATANATSVNKPMYRFWMGYYSNGKWSWNMLQDYSTNNKITWTPTKLGLYEVNVHVRDSASSEAFEVVKYYDFTAKVSDREIIVLDAGHGGTDPGAVSSSSTGSLREADINLDQTLILGDLLKAYGFNVIYTRDINTTLSLEDRVAVANKAGADLFLSIHHDSVYPNTTAKGISTHYSTWRPLLDNEGLAIKDTIYGSDIIYDRTPCDAATKSKILAEMLVNNIATLGFNICPQENGSGAHDHNLYVTRNTTMPSVLIEAGFMSNDTEVERVAKKAVQQSIAQKIIETLVAFYSK
jgi:N-acetylmuramoyl-L-alanine amidase